LCEDADRKRMVCFRFPRARMPDGKDWPDYQVRLFRNLPGVEFRGHPHTVLYYGDVPLDRVDDPKHGLGLNVATAPDFPIVHLPRLRGMRREWWEGEGRSELVDLPEPTVVACCGLYGERVNQALEGIRRLRPFVDRYIIIADETVTEDQRRKLLEAGCEVYFERWVDSTVAMRNAYLRRIQTGDWVVVHDPDEWFNQRFCEDLRGLVAEAEREGYNLLLINSHDITRRLDGSRSESKSSFYKNLIFKKVPGTHYVGTAFAAGTDRTERERDYGWHETLLIPGARTKQLPDEYWYEHVKEEHEIWERALRNTFTCGGGNDLRERNPAWVRLREICSSLGIETWPQLRNYLRKGNIDPRLKEWFWENRFDGTDAAHEAMEGGRWYFEYLHPEEAKFPDGRVWKPVFGVDPNSPAGVMRYVEEQYLKVLGRHADLPGKEYYTKAILEGRIAREDLPRLLRASREYRERSGTPEERVRVQVPVDVDVRLDERVAMRALMQSRLWALDERVAMRALMQSRLWAERIRPRLDLGGYILERVSDRDTFLREFYATREGVEKHEFIELLRRFWRRRG